jgi:hypothetical protein
MCQVCDMFLLVVQPLYQSAASDATAVMCDGIFR